MFTLNNVHIEFNTRDCSICQKESETAVGMTLLHMDLFFMYSFDQWNRLFLLKFSVYLLYC